MLLELKQRHSNEEEEFQERIKTDPAMKYWKSNDILNKERKIESMGATGKYDEARMLRKIMKLQKKEEKKIYQKQSSFKIK